MVAVITGVTKEVPVARATPPVGAAYQLMVVPKLVPADNAADNVTEPASHLLAGVEPDMTGTIEIIVAATVVLLADTQPLAVIAPAK